MAPILKSLSPQSQSIFEKLQPYLKKVKIQPQSKEVLSGMAQYNPGDQSIWYNKDIGNQGNYPDTNTKYADRALPHEAAHHLSENFRTDKEKQKIKESYKKDFDKFYEKKPLSDKFIGKDAPYYLKNEHEYSAEHLTDALGSQTYPYKPMDKFAKVERGEIFQPIAERLYKPQDGYRVMEGKIRKNVKSSPKVLGELFSKDDKSVVEKLKPFLQKHPLEDSRYVGPNELKSGAGATNESAPLATKEFTNKETEEKELGIDKDKYVDDKNTRYIYQDKERMKKDFTVNNTDDIPNLLTNGDKESEGAKNLIEKLKPYYKDKKITFVDSFTFNPKGRARYNNSTGEMQIKKDEVPSAFYHELGHAIDYERLPKNIQDKFEELYEADLKNQKASGRTGSSDLTKMYQYENSKEYTAELIARAAQRYANNDMDDDSIFGKRDKVMDKLFKMLIDKPELFKK